MNTMRRKADGFLRNAALRDGFRDQYAVVRSYGTVIIELWHGGGARPWRVSCTITEGDTVSSTDAAFRTLNEARAEFRRLMRQHP